ncbi:MAG: 2Fe-2S iron-sulfur cluster binding domain-containing protein [Deltaproteobacteria bacterium]|nr:2Fe-2S iron-sulfur cluster binding domain-containing protein [Deltaproteobacteria bacterium]
MATEDKLVTIHVMGEAFRVPEGSTIMTALEYAGFQLTTGVGCREGFCGACGTLYREAGDYKIKGGLACQTVVTDGMHLAQIPFVPAAKPVYDIEALSPDEEAIKRIYPEVFRCVACSTCTKICPQDIQVMDYVQCLMRGDIAQAANISFDCLRCGLCGLRCPAEIVQYNAATLARRLYGRYLARPSERLERRVEAIARGDYDAQLDELQGLDADALKKRYYDREIKTK